MYRQAMNCQKQMSIFVERMDGQSIYDDFISGDVESLYMEMYRGLVCFASRYLGPNYSFLSEDIVQECIYGAFKRKDTIKPDRLKPYIFTSVRNSCLNVLRKGRSSDNYLKHFNESDNDFINNIIEEETFQILFNAIEKLSLTHREVLNMSFFEGLKICEIAQKLSLSEIAVKKRKASALSALKDILTREGLIGPEVALLALAVLIV